jgi:hypothetical protein
VNNVGNVVCKFQLSGYTRHCSRKQLTRIKQKQIHGEKTANYSKSSAFPRYSQGLRSLKVFIVNTKTANLTLKQAKKEKYSRV